MEDLSEAFGLNQRASALDPETVSETDVPQICVLIERRTTVWALSTVATVTCGACEHACEPRVSLPGVGGA